jgi:NAD(P)-dependent dehydrogenase (short-subunit alcohol dehydrogenase family)
MTSRFKGKVALVTGGGTGMGRAGALRLAAEGAKVVIAGRRPAELKATASLAAKLDGEIWSISADVTAAEQVEQLVAQICAIHGGLDLAWNNAGALGSFAPTADISIEDFDAVMAVNLRGTFLCIREEIRAMRKRGGGAIVNTSSWTAMGAMPGTTAYAASKGALDAMVRTAALEVGGDNIRINNLAPGVIVTPMSLGAIGDEEAMAPFANHAALRRIGRSEDVADALTWLLSDDARFVTGQTIAVDGGFSIGGPRPWAEAC